MTLEEADYILMIAGTSFFGANVVTLDEVAQARAIRDEYDNNLKAAKQALRYKKAPLHERIQND